MNRILNFHFPGTTGNSARMYPSAYYIDQAYAPVAVRLYAESAPTVDAEFDVYDDGVSIFADRTSYEFNVSTGVTSGSASTGIYLGEDQNSDESGEDFDEGLVIDEGSWVYCDIKSAGGGKNFTVQLELEPISEGETEE